MMINRSDDPGKARAWMSSQWSAAEAQEALLDRVNARDSLAHLEATDQEADRGAATRGEASEIGAVDDVVDRFGRLSRDDQRTVRDRIDEMTDDAGP